MARLFLKLNGAELTFAKDEAVRMMLALAAGEIDEQAVAEWFRMHLAAD